MRVFFVLMFFSLNCFSYEYEKCFDQLDQKFKDVPLYGLLSHKNKVTFEQMSDNRFANQQDKIDITSFANDRKICAEQRKIELIKDNVDIEIVRAIVKFDKQKVELLLNLFNEKITYGEFAKLHDDYSSELDQVIEYSRNQLKINNEQARLQEEARQKAINARMFYDALGNMSNTFSNMGRPSTTCTPNGFGGYICR